MYTPFGFPSQSAALELPVICKDDVGDEPWTFKWSLCGIPARFWIQRRSYLFEQIKNRNTPYQHANTQTLRRYTDYQRLRHIIDVGLNIGMMSAQYNCFSDRVTAFEPAPKMMELAAKNLVLNNATNNVTCYQLALADKSGIMNFSDITDNGAINRLTSDTAHLKINRKLSTCFKVDVTTIDQFDFDDVDAIKIDTEGSELLVIHGAIDTIKRCLPLIQAELMLTTIVNWKSPTGERHHPQHAFDLLADLGYKMFYGGNKLVDPAYPVFSNDHTRQKWEYVKGLSDVFFIHNTKIPKSLKTSFQFYGKAA